MMASLRYEIVEWTRMLFEPGMEWMERYWLEEGYKAETELLILRWPVERDLKLKTQTRGEGNRP